VEHCVTRLKQSEGAAANHSVGPNREVVDERIITPALDQTVFVYKVKTFGM